MQEIPEFNPDLEELVVGTSNPGHYRVTPISSQDKPTYEHVARRLVAASHRNREFLTEVARRVPSTPGRVRVRFTLEPGSRTPSNELDWSEISLPVEIASELSPLASEIVHHLRTALEYVMFNMVWTDTGKRPVDQIKMPCHKTEDGWRERRRYRPLNQLSPDNLSALRAVQPFTGTTWLAQLTGLSNPDKHHSPIRVLPAIQWAMPNEMVLDRWQEVDAIPRLMVRKNEQQIEFTETIQTIMLGLIDLANPLLVADGLNPIVVAPRGP